MNKTLLLILCDFLLLNLLALTRWEKAEPPSAKQPPVPEMAANAATKDKDLVDTMRQTLTDEQARRDELAQKLTAADSTLAAREQSLTQLQTEKTQLTAKLNTSEQTAADLGKKVAVATQEATLTKEQLAQIQRELEEKRAETDRQKLALASLEAKREKEQAEARKQIEGLTVAVIVGEQEKKTLREQTDTLKGQVETERTERIKVQETTTKLAAGVGQLAEKSTELTKEIRDNRPINANVLFNDFLANRVQTTFTANRKGFLGAVNRTEETRTVFVTKAGRTYALLHIADTPFSLIQPGVDWEKLTVEFLRPGAGRATAATIEFLAHDPRIVVLPVPAEQATALGAKAYPLAVDPFKFPEAVLVNGGGKGYGEVSFKLDAAQPGFVRVDNRIFKRIFGDFAPSRGDLVFSKTGELLGIMVNSDYCALLGNFTPVKTMKTGDDVKAQVTSQILDDLSARYRALPLPLQ